ncbi:PaaI family thioesterase [Kiloniella laminariae]|uniref:PaaI family thioesterase n=1 Tax=Kiloniella laminariae TaxID=454162 RepID=A0ABT4LN30_9PROT|nr:PaaI family thioesterase [Kiloniella laminariae]MCZ4282508.1 PaaI family thioesterase [Kiloniella laminariae]
MTKRFDPPNPDYKQLVMDSYHYSGFGKTLGAEFSVIEPGHVEMILPFRDELAQHHGFFQGGVIGAMADYAGGFASYTLINAGDSMLTVEYKINMMAPGAGVSLRATGTVLRPGRRVTIARMDVFARQSDGSEVHIAAGQGTFMRMENTPDVAATIGRLQKNKTN